jgi:hypothetical protein
VEIWWTSNILVDRCPHSFLFRALTSHSPDLKRQATLLRIAASDLERALQDLSEAENGLVSEDRRQASSDNARESAGEGSDTRSIAEKMEGMMLYKLAKVVKSSSPQFLSPAGTSFEKCCMLSSALGILIAL